MQTKFLALLILSMSVLMSGCNRIQHVPKTSTGIKVDKTLYSKYFHDAYPKQRKAAKKYKQYRAKDDKEFDAIKNKLTKVESSKGYYIEAGKPYVTAKTAELIKKIGNDFADSLKARNYPEYRLIITSMFRTKKDVAGLKKKSSNAVSNSTHEYAVSFDITYRRYKSSEFSKTVEYQQLYNILTDILVNVKKQDKCYIIQEFRQPCFHLTTR
jgi:hypothetical protein